MRNQLQSERANEMLRIPGSRFYTSWLSINHCNQGVMPTRGVTTLCQPSLTRKTWIMVWQLNKLPVYQNKCSLAIDGRHKPAWKTLQHHLLNVIGFPSTEPNEITKRFCKLTNKPCKLDPASNRMLHVHISSLLLTNLRWQSGRFNVRGNVYIILLWLTFVRFALLHASAYYVE